jgi:hypothetical protein
MHVATVESSTLASVSYDEAQELLQLEFCGGAVYQYFGVPAVVHQALLGAPSKGRYFNHAIRGRFRYRLIRDAVMAAPKAEIAAGRAC